ncbi:MAG: cupin domain-containing protein [Deltaproteobacteria bacterium]
MFPKVSPGPGVIRQVLADAHELMVVSFRFEKGAEGALHHHVHVQSTYVAAGRFAFTIDGDTVEIATGDSLVIPSNAVHGCVCLEAGELIDNFTPRRDDFL